MECNNDYKEAMGKIIKAKIARIGSAGPPGPRGPQGEKGEPGESGELTNRSAYLVTFNSPNTKRNITTGETVLPGERIPIRREELDISDIVTLDSEDNTILFNVPGYYKITLIISGYADSEDDTFDPTKDFVSIGFRLVGTDDIFIGASRWNYTQDPVQVVAHGIISVPSIVNPYEIVNLSPSTLYLDSPSLDNISSESYFTNSLVTIIAEYLGRQGS